MHVYAIDDISIAQKNILLFVMQFVPMHISERTNYDQNLNLLFLICRSIEKKKIVAYLFVDYYVISA